MIIEDTTKRKIKNYIGLGYCVVKIAELVFAIVMIIAVYGLSNDLVKDSGLAIFSQFIMWIIVAYFVISVILLVLFILHLFLAKHPSTQAWQAAFFMLIAAVTLFFRIVVIIFFPKLFWLIFVPIIMIVWASFQGIRADKDRKNILNHKTNEAVVDELKSKLNNYDNHEE